MRWCSAITKNLRFFVGSWQASLVSEGIIVFFDSECLLCCGSVRWLNRLDAGDRLRFAPLGGKTANEWGISKEEDSMALLRGGEIFRGSIAAGGAFEEAGGLGRVIAWILKIIPSRLREWGYRLIARHRKSLVTKGSCAFPEEGLPEKLLD